MFPPHDGQLQKPDHTVCMRSFLFSQDCGSAPPRLRVRTSTFRVSSVAFSASVQFVVVVGGIQLSPARAQSFFDFLPWVQSAPEPTDTTLPYELTVVVAGDEKGVKQSVLDASTLQRLGSDAPPDADALVRRAQPDLPRVVNALWGAGYYNASVAIDIAGVPPRIGMDRTQAAIVAAAVYPGRARALAALRESASRRSRPRGAAGRNHRALARLHRSTRRPLVWLCTAGRSLFARNLCLDPPFNLADRSRVGGSYQHAGRGFGPRCVRTTAGGH